MSKNVTIFSLWAIIATLAAFVVTVSVAGPLAQTNGTPEGYPPPPTFSPPTPYPGQPPTPTVDTSPPTAYPAITEESPPVAPTTAVEGEASDPALSPTVINQIEAVPESAAATNPQPAEGSRAVLWIAFLIAALLLGLAVLLTTRLIGRRSR